MNNPSRSQTEVRMITLSNLSQYLRHLRDRDLERIANRHGVQSPYLDRIAATHAITQSYLEALAKTLAEWETELDIALSGPVMPSPPPTEESVKPRRGRKSSRPGGNNSA